MLKERPGSVYLVVEPAQRIKTAPTAAGPELCVPVPLIARTDFHEEAPRRNFIF